MEPKKLEIFMTAADLGSFSKASEVVGYTQSGLTHMMDSLEKEIGFPLLQRNHAGIQLTPQGEKLMPAIREFLQANAKLENCIQDVSQHSSEVIRIAAYASITMHWMPELLYRFKRICPHVEFDLRMVDDATEPFELLKNNQTDIIFASFHETSFCQWTPLYHEKMFAILPKNYPLSHSDYFPLENFNNQPFLMPYGKFDQDVHHIFDPLQIHPHSTLCRVDDETIIRMVSKNLGITMMSELMIRGKIDDVLCLPVHPQAQRELGMGILASKNVSSNIHRIKNCVLEFIEEYKTLKSF